MADDESQSQFRVSRLSTPDPMVFEIQVFRYGGGDLLQPPARKAAQAFLAGYDDTGGAWQIQEARRGALSTWSFFVTQPTGVQALGEACGALRGVEGLWTPVPARGIGNRRPRWPGVAEGRRPLGYS